MLGRGPYRGVLGGAEAGDQSRVGLVGLGAHQFTLAEGLDLGGVDDADAHAVGVQEQRVGFTVRTGGFEAGVQRRGKGTDLQPRLRSLAAAL